MPVKLGKNGLVHYPSLSSFIGKNIIDVIPPIKEHYSCTRTIDCIGIKGYRIITFMGLEKRIEIICETDNIEDIAKDVVAPSEKDWLIMDIFEYIEHPKQGKGYY